MAISTENANSQLAIINTKFDAGTISSAELKAELQKLIVQIDVTDTTASADAKTIFFSGSDEVKEQAKALGNTGHRTIHGTAAYNFLNVDKNQILQEALDNIFGDYQGTDANNFLNVDKDGAWHTVSKRFAAATSGDVILLVGENALTNRILFQTEYPELLKEGRVTSINGLDPDIYGFGLQGDELLDTMKYDTKARQFASGTNSSLLASLTFSEVDNRVAQDAGKTQSLLVFADEKLNLSTESRITLANGYKGFGKLTTVLGIVLVTSASAQAYEAGRTEEAKRIWIDYGVETGGDITGGVIAGGIAVALIGVATLPAVILVGGIALLGGFIGADLAGDIKDKWFNDAISDDVKLQL